MENTFEYHFEKAIQAILDNSKIKLGDDSEAIRRGLKRHVWHLVLYRIDKIVTKLVA